MRTDFVIRNGHLEWVAPESKPATDEAAVIRAELPAIWAATDEAAWAELYAAATHYGRVAAAYNVGRISLVLETDPYQLIERLAAHLNIAGKLQPGHPEVDWVAVVFRGLTFHARAFGDRPSMHGTFVPWKKKEF